MLKPAANTNGLTGFPAVLPESVLFVCTGNCCRSVMAEAIFRGLCLSAGLDILILSAGTDAIEGMTATATTCALLKKKGLDGQGHRARRLNRELIASAEWIIAMEKVHCRYILERWPAALTKVRLLMDFYPEEDPLLRESGVPDPIGMSLSFYENVHEIIEKSCLNLFQVIFSPDGGECPPLRQQAHHSKPLLHWQNSNLRPLG